MVGAWRLSGAGEVIWLTGFCTLIAFGALRYSLGAPVPLLAQRFYIGLAGFGTLERACEDHLFLQRRRKADGFVARR